MSLNLTVPVDESLLKPKIIVIGVGGAGGNAVNNMIVSNLEGVDFLACNTDAQALLQSQVEKERRIQLGLTITNGLGAGARPEIGRASAEEAMDELVDHIKDANMIFITAGMGGGTGTGAAPVIAKAARENGILTVGVVTKPFHFEGRTRMKLAESGIKELQEYVDTLIVIPNQNLFRIANEKTTFADAFKMADDVLYSGVRGVTDLMVMPGLINLDFADIRTVMSEMGKAMMGTGQAEGENRAIESAESAISNPLLDDVSMKGARGMLINITGGLDMTLFEVDEAANRIREEVDADANIIFGSTFDESLQGIIRVSVVATGIDQPEERRRPTDEYNGGNDGDGQPKPTQFEQPSLPEAQIVGEAEQHEKAEGQEEAPAASVSIPSARTASEMMSEAAPQIDEDKSNQEYFETPKAVEAEPQEEDYETGKKKANPFAAAAMANAGKSPKSKSGLSFGFFSKSNNEAKTEETPEKSTQQSAPQIKSASSAQHQPELKGLDPKEEAEKSEDEILEIPAFLRRQAN